MATPAVVPTAPIDPFLDDRFAPLDTREGGEGFAAQLAQLAEEHPEFAPQPAAEPVEPAPVEVAPPSEPEPPVVLQNDDGSTITVEKTKRGWSASLQSKDTGINPEVFYGRTKEEMWQRVAAGKINATEKIKTLTRRQKLGEEEPAPPTPPAQPNVRKLDANEAFEIKTQLANDPDLALQTWFQKKTGLSLEQLVQMAKRGQAAGQELAVESVARAFIEDTPEYYATPGNYAAMVGRLAKLKIKRVVNAANFDEVMSALADGGHWTKQNLQAVFEDLSDSGLLEHKPATEPEPEPEALPAAPPQPAGIQPVARRPRVGLGIRQSQAAPAPVAVPDRPPSAEDLDNLSDAELEKLWSETRRHRAGTGRR